MKKFTKANKIVIVAVLVLVAATSTIFGVKAYSNYQDKQAINSSLSQISKYDNNFTAETDRSKKLATLKDIENEYSNYKKSQKVFSGVSNKYSDEISKMKKAFTDGYDQIVSKNTLLNIDKITDKSSLNTAKTNLQNELKLITGDKDIICDTKDLANYNTKISTVIKSYDARTKSIEDEAAKAAAEAKAKKDAEAAAAKKKADVEAATKSATSASTSNTGSTSVPDSSKSNTKKSSSSGNKTSSHKSKGNSSKGGVTLPNGVFIPNGWYRCDYPLDKNGNKILGRTRYYYPDGTIICETGEKHNIRDFS